MQEPLEECPDEIRNCIHECKALLKSFDYIYLQHVAINKNKVAHLVAKSRLEENGLSLALGRIPQDIQSAIAQESLLYKNLQV